MERRVDEISSNVVRRDLLDYVTISGAGEPGIPQQSAFASYPLDAPLPALCVSTTFQPCRIHRFTISFIFIFISISF